MRTPSGLLYPHAITALCATLLFGACGGGDVSLPPDGQPAVLKILDGDEQSGRVSEALAKPLLVEVLDSRGEPVAGVTVAFEFGSAGAGAAVVPQEKTTNSAGQADARLVLGTTVGTQTGLVRVVAPAGSEALQTPFTAIALSDDANSMVAAGGEDQTGHVLQPLDDRLVVEVRDEFDNPVAGVPITWAAAGGGSVSEEIVPTDEDGRSRVERILGPTVGQQTTLASSEGLAGSPVVFIHTAVAGDASRLTIESGDDQTGAVGSLLPAELVVRLIDSEGNGVPNTAVTWVPVGGGSPNPQNTTTDGDGRTSTRWTLGPALGPQRMDAVVSGVGFVSFDATATAGAPASLFIRTQPSPTARNGIPFDRQPVIQLRDPQGNDVATAGVQVTASLNGGGELEGATRLTTDAAGRATFTDLAISGAPGPRTLVFQAVGYAPVTSDEIAVAAIGTTTTITGDSPDPSQVGTAFTVSFRVASDGPSPTGNVRVSDGVDSCTGPLSGGAGSCSLTLSSVGQRTLTATYAGEPGLSGSSDSEPHTVTAAPPPPPASTTTTITEDNPDPSVSGQTVTVRFSVTSSAGSPGGTVTVTADGPGAPSCSAALSDGSGSCDLSMGRTGPRTLTATYSGGTGFAASSDTETHTVTDAQPSNQPPTAVFTPDCDELECDFDNDSDDPDGQVVSHLWEFGDGNTSDNREPRHEYSTGGTYTVRLTVTDDDGATTTATQSLTVSEDAASTNTRFEVDDPDPTVPGQQFTVTLSVSSSDGTPEGTATVSDGVDSCPITITAGSGSCTLALTTVGDRTLTATFAGNASFAPSSAREDHRVNQPAPASTTTQITGDSPDPSEAEQDVTVTFTVTSSSGSPDGTVEVTSDGGGSCSALVSQGSCVLRPGQGTTTITAAYQGSSAFAASSDTEPHAVNGPPPANLPPSANPDGTQTEAGVPVTILVLANDSDPNGTPLTIVNVTMPGNGTAVDNPDGTITYTPIPGFVGSDAFNYTVSDGELTDDATVSMTVTPSGVLGLRTEPPAAIPSGQVLAPEPEVELLSANGDPLQVEGVTISAAPVPAGGATLVGTTTLPTDGNGRARFEDLSIQAEPGSTVAIAFTASGFAEIDSQAILIEGD